MVGQISVPKKSYGPIGLIATNSDKLSILDQAIRGLATSERTTTTIAREFSRIADISAVHARDIVTEIMSFHDVRLRSGMSVEELFDAITENLNKEADSEWKENYLKGG